MPERIFFQCSLPRSGSTLFQNLINQDERFYASANNGLLNLVAAANYNFTSSPEFKAQDPSVMQHAFGGFCLGAMHGFYNAITERPYILDKSRGNFANYEFVNHYYPEPKIVCFVRNMPDIFASFEKLFRKDAHKASVLVNTAAMQGTTTRKRALIRYNSFEPIMRVFHQSINAGLDKKILFIRYEDFCVKPQEQIERFYNYLDLSPAKIECNNIKQTVLENEEVYEESYTGLLKIRPNLSILPSDAVAILGQDVYTWLMDLFKNYNSYFGYH